MRAVRLQAPGRLEAAALPAPPDAGPGEARVRVRRIGICGTDLHAFAGRQPFFTYPRVLGHELGVEVLAVGAGVAELSPGQRCAVEPYLNCGACVACRRGRPNCCVNLRVLGVHVDGGMTEELVLPARKLHPSGRLTLEQLALVEPLGIGAHAVARAAPEPGEFALVIGAGPIGLATMQFAAAAQARVIALDVNRERLDFCRRQLGVAHAVEAVGDVVGTLRDLTQGEMPTVVFDATGSPAAMRAAFQYPAAGGRLVLVGLFQGELAFDDPQFHRRELTLLASRNALPSDFRRIISLIEDGRIDTTPWITHRAVLAQLPAAFAPWTRPETGVIKAMVEV